MGSRLRGNDVVFDLPAASLPAEGQANPGRRLSALVEASGDTGIDRDILADQRIHLDRTGLGAAIGGDVGRQVELGARQEHRAAHSYRDSGRGSGIVLKAGNPAFKGRGPPFDRADAGADRKISCRAGIFFRRDSRSQRRICCCAG